MPKGTNQKLKLYYLAQIMVNNTDDEHAMTLQDIKIALEYYDITADRKSLYDDLNVLRDMGLDILGEQRGRSYYYHVGKKKFELAELKLLVDAIQSSKFITAKKSHELIKKLESFASRYEAAQLQRQVVVAGRIKTMNESIYYNVDAIHSAIATNHKIRFQYFQWNIKKQMELRHDGQFYEVSPWALTWDDENYYLVGYDAQAEKIKHYRVDKMRKLTIMDDKREGKEYFKQFNLAAYAKKNFGMFGGEEENVRIQFSNDLVGVVIDRFGKDIIISPIDDEHFTVNVDVAIGSQFFGWVFALGMGVKILSPSSVVERMKQEVDALHELYGR